MASGCTRGIGVATIVSALTFLWAGAAPRRTPPTGEPLAVESTALVPLETEKSVSILGIRGQVTIATHDDHDLRLVSRAPGPNGAELPVGIWQEGSKLIVAPAPGDKETERQLHVEVPSGFAVAVDAAESEVVIAGVVGGVELSGVNLSASVVSCRGTVAADLQGGRLRLSQSDSANLKLRGTALEADDVQGRLDVHATGGTISLASIAGPTELESEATIVRIEGVTGSLHVKAHKGDAIVSGVRVGADLELSDTPLKMKDGAGEISVTTDAPVEFEAMAASLRFDMYGGSLRGKGNQGTLEVRTRNTEVTVEGIVLGMRVQGDGLRARLEDIGGELYIETTGSDVTLDRVGTVVVKIQTGNVSVQRAQGAVQAEVRNGNVRIIDGTGPVLLDLDGGDADVSWASLSGGADSQLTNKTGRVTVRFPVTGPCRVDAKSLYGRIESDLPAVSVTDDRRAAQGPVNGGSRPVVRITANGDIQLSGGSGASNAN